MNRRSFLLSSIASGALIGIPLRAWGASGILSTALVLTDVGGANHADAVVEFVGRLVEQGVWVTCAVRTGQGFDVAGLERVLASLAEVGSGVDLALDLPELARLSPYFQARATHDARERLRAITKFGAAFAPPQTVLCDTVEAPAEPTGVRATGIRNVLVRPVEDAIVRSETWEDGVVRFYGGERLGPQQPFTFRRGEAGDESALIYYVSAKDLEGLSRAQAAGWADDLAAGLQKQELNGRISLMTVADFQLRDDFAARRLVSVLLERSDGATEEDGVQIAAFREALAGRGIPTAMKPAGQLFWVARKAGEGSGEGSGDRPLVPVDMTCVPQAPSRIGAAVTVAPGFVLSLMPEDEGTPGIDGCAVLRQTMTRIDPERATTRVAQVLGGEQDRIVVLDAAGLAAPEARRRVMQDLEALRDDGITQFVAIGDYAAALHTDEPVAVRHRLTRRAMVNAGEMTVPAPGDEERERLLNDARHAWTYLEKYEEKATGLCPATVDLRPGGDIQRTVTMWDVGSNLNGIVAAAELGLITRKQAEARFKRILPNIIGRSTDGRLLPQGWIRTDRHRWGIRDFDGCDGGRLLASLDYMRRHFGMEEALAKLVASWDLDKVVIDGEIQSVIDRKLVSTFGSHCAHYAALAFRRWGLNPASPYETFTGRGAGDGEVALLEAVSRIGPLGTEPLLLEAVELGMSPESGYLADVLLSAMEEEYSQNDRLICVSESPIDREPWFIYQGLELGSGARSWRLDTVGHHPEYMTREMADELMTFSTKAAFLWAACRPGPFTRTLLDFAREHGRDTVGFRSGVNVRTQRPMAHYTDLNTNAIILQAIAHMLRPTG